MVLCEGYSWTDGTFKELTPNNTNFRKFAKEILMLNLMNNHGSELNKNIFFSKHKIAFQLDLTDGQVLDSQEFRDHTIAQ